MQEIKTVMPEETDKKEMAQIVSAPFCGTPFQPFEEGSEPIAHWFKRFDVLLKINKVKESEKMDHLIAVGGIKIYEILVSVCAPKEVENCAYEEIKPIVIKMLSAKVDRSVARMQFFNRVQEAGESVQEFALSLKEIATACEFGSTEFECTLTNRFIYCLRDTAVKTAVVKSKKEKFEDAVAEALLQESVLGAGESSEVNRVSAKFCTATAIKKPITRFFTLLLEVHNTYQIYTFKVDKVEKNPV